tara:strand:+ start:9834 stop:12113 length:2280 start_codon:yes stop_codon:yes gene_type:complete
LDVERFIAEIVNSDWYSDQLVHWEKIPGRKFIPGKLKSDLSQSMKNVLESKSIDRLYCHQVESIDLALLGRHVIITTSTASGKSLCYNIPVYETLSRDKFSTALYVFPTKALAQDQYKELDLFHNFFKNVAHGLFDGDTSSVDRSYIRKNSRLLVTNPDMLHLGVLPHSNLWASFLRGLKYVVIDEAHIYRGVFGSHVANVIRRLRRLCSKYGASPKFILSSATIANPKDLAFNLTGLDVELVNIDGSPSAAKHFIFWNPPFENQDFGTRKSANVESAKLMSELIKRGIKTINFVRGRNQSEILSLYTKNYLSDKNKYEATKIASYHGNYLAADRRDIEKQLFEGELLGIVSTNAMELGVDIGHLDATILTGFPGSVSSSWQQSGRSGRGEQESLSLLVASNDPIDQYIMDYPSAFFGKSVEYSLLSPANSHIQKPHLKCSAYEMPISMGDTEFFGPEMLWSADELTESGSLTIKSSQWYPSASISYPAGDVDIRGIGSSTYVLVDKVTGAILETVDETTVYKSFYPGAVHLHKGESFLIAEIDFPANTIYCTQSEAPYYTDSKSLTQISVVNTIGSRHVGNTIVHYGVVNISTDVVSFKRIHKYSNQVITEEKLTLPNISFDTMAVWVDVSQEILERVQSFGFNQFGGLHGFEHLIMSLIPMFAMCHRDDVGGVSSLSHPDTGTPQIFVFDNYPGGVGISELGYEIMEELWARSLNMIQRCLCESGCPACIQFPGCGRNNELLDKKSAKLILEEIIVV